MGKIAVFCSAASNIDPDFFSAAEELGHFAGKANHKIVFGGCNMGLMESLAKASKESGALTIGIVPMIIEQGGKKSDYLDVNIPCDNLNDRKELMMLHGDVFVALPGGLGTLDEIFTVVASATIGYHSKKVILLNIKGFYKGLISLLDDFQKTGVIRSPWREHILIAEDMENLKAMLKDILD